jgi:hypothetical protein
LFSRTDIEQSSWFLDELIEPLDNVRPDVLASRTGFVSTGVNDAQGIDELDLRKRSNSVDIEDRTRSTSGTWSSYKPGVLRGPVPAVDDMPSIAEELFDDARELVTAHPTMDRISCRKPSDYESRLIVIL